MCMCVQKSPTTRRFSYLPAIFPGNFMQPYICISCYFIDIWCHNVYIRAYYFHRGRTSQSCCRTVFPDACSVYFPFNSVLYDTSSIALLIISPIFDRVQVALFAVYCTRQSRYAIFFVPPDAAVNAGVLVRLYFTSVIINFDGAQRETIVLKTRPRRRLIFPGMRIFRVPRGIYPMPRDVHSVL